MTSPVSTQFGSPLRGTYPVSSGYGDRDGTLHAGTDYAAPAGTTVQSVYAGRVVESGYDGGWGNTVLIDHGTVNGEHVYTRYAHLLGTPVVKVGATVTMGAELGKVGSTGDSTGNHLHFGTYVGDTATNATSVNPLDILKGGVKGLLDDLGDALGGLIPEDPLSGLAGGIGAGLGALLERLAKAADAYTSKAKIAEQIATSVTKVFLPSSLLRGAAGGLGIILLCFSLYFLGRELRA